MARSLSCVSPPPAAAPAPPLALPATASLSAPARPLPAPAALPAAPLGSASPPRPAATGPPALDVSREFCATPPQPETAHKNVKTNAPTHEASELRVTCCGTAALVPLPKRRRDKTPCYWAVPCSRCWRSDTRGLGSRSPRRGSATVLDRPGPRAARSTPSARQRRPPHLTRPHRSRVSPCKHTARRGLRLGRRLPVVVRSGTEWRSRTDRRRSHRAPTCWRCTGSKCGNAALARHRSCSADRPRYTRHRQRVRAPDIGDAEAALAEHSCSCTPQRTDRVMAFRRLPACLVHRSQVQRRRCWERQQRWKPLRSSSDRGWWRCSPEPGAR